MAYPDVKSVNPLELWDLRPLREVHLERAKQSVNERRAWLAAGASQ